MTKPPSEVTSPFGLKYQLERDLHPFIRNELGRLPRRRTGVYALWLPTEYEGQHECLYVGMSEACVRRRLLQHLQNETNPELLRQLWLFRDLAMFSVVFTNGRKETLDLETAVIQAWQPTTNRNKLG